MAKKILINYLLIVLLALIMPFVVQCGGLFKTDFYIMSGSENEELEPIIEEFAKKNGVNIHMNYKGSVDIMLELEDGNVKIKDDIFADAVWPANSLWLKLGDKKHILKHEKSIMTSPVVFGIKKSLAQSLGFTDKDIRIKDILKAINEKKLTFMMTSATQSNSGASAYIGFIYALLGNPEYIKITDLENPVFKKEMRQLLSGINRSSGSSGWLKDLFLKGDYDAMVNYESVIIETNRELVKQGKEPLYVIYPVDGIVMADSPLCYVSGNDKRKEEIFLKFSDYLLSGEIQDKILKLGRRTGFGGSITNYDKKVFNEEWGIKPEKILSPIKMPASDVIYEALSLYQTELRKPSFTVFCLDFSGSMQGPGEAQLKNAIKLLLNQKEAKKYLINMSNDDISVIIPFNSSPIGMNKINGNDEKLMNEALDYVLNLQTHGGTDIYAPVIAGLNEIKKINISDYIPAVILMTDGESNTNLSFNDLKKEWTASGLDIPVFSILFGEASEKQLKEITELTRGKIFDGRHDLIKAFRNAKGYN